MDKEKGFLKVLGSKGTKQILEHFYHHKKSENIDLALFVNTPTLNGGVKAALEIWSH